MVEFPELPFGNIPSEWKGSLAPFEIVPGTRWIIEKGSVQAYRHWMDELHRANPGDLIPLQWGPHYIGASRPGIRKRALSGRLTVFTFAVVEPVRSLMGRVQYRESRETYDYLVKSECEAWRDQLFEQREEERAAFFAERDGRVQKLPRAHRKGTKK